jgi:hypothetical protein
MSKKSLMFVPVLVGMKAIRKQSEEASIFSVHFFKVKSITCLEDRPGAVVKSSHWCQEVLGSSGISAIIAGVRLSRENSPPNPTKRGSFERWACP